MEGILTKRIHLNNSMVREFSEAQLVKNAMSGDKEAFLCLINKHKEYLYKTAFLYVKNEHDASDIYQETVYKAFISIKKLKKSQYFKTWITRILINNVNDKIRKDSKLVFYEEKENISSSNEDADLVTNIDLFNAIDKLSDKHKTAIILRYIHDMPIKEVATIMECSENTTKSYIYRALKILKENLSRCSL